MPQPFGWRPFTPFKKTDLAHPPKYVPLTAPVAKESTMSFISVLEAVGKDAEKILSEVVKYAVPVGSLVSLLFPAAAVPVATATTVAGLIQTAVLEIEAKSSALPTSLTAAQKSADVIQLIGPAVSAILAQEKLPSDPTTIANYVAAISAILNVVPAATA